jgi:ankyrin repeat protein
MRFSLKKLFTKAAAKAAPVTDPPDNTGSAAHYASLADCIRDGTVAELAAWIRKDPDSIHETSTIAVGKRNFVEVNAIQLAAVLGMAAKMKMLYDAGADMDAPLQKGYTLPILAARSKNADTMAFACTHSTADINAAQQSGRTALIEACISGDADVVREILKRNPDIAVCPEYGVPALTAAAKGGHTPIIRLLLDAGADINQSSSGNQTALWWALHCRKTDTVEYLLQHNADRYATDDRGCTILMKAAEAGYAPLVKNLLEEGANPNQADHSKNTALHYVVLGVDTPAVTDILDLLIRHEAHPGFKNSSDDTPLVLADRLRKKNTAAFLRKLPTTELKIKTDHFVHGTAQKIKTLKPIGLRSTRKNSPA